MTCLPATSPLLFNTLLLSWLLVGESGSGQVAASVQLAVGARRRAVGMIVTSDRANGLLSRSGGFGEGESRASVLGLNSYGTGYWGT